MYQEEFSRTNEIWQKFFIPFNIYGMLKSVFPPSKTTDVNSYLYYFFYSHPITHLI
jgi:hypothetical protein